MKNYSSTANLTDQETVRGWIWWNIQLFLLPTLLPAGNQLASSPLSQTELNFVYFMLNFFAVVLIFRKFLTRSLQCNTAKPTCFFKTVIIGLVLYYILSRCTISAICRISPNFQNANDIQIADFRESNPYLTICGTVLLAPVAEECFYRGLFFQNLERKSESIAYLVSMSVFSLVHVLGYIDRISPLTFVLSFFQYLPAGFCLAWGCKTSGNIIAPIIMHMIINACSIL